MQSEIPRSNIWYQRAWISTRVMTKCSRAAIVCRPDDNLLYTEKIPPASAPGTCAGCTGRPIACSYTHAVGCTFWKRRESNASFHIVHRLETSATTPLAFHHRPPLYPTNVARCTWANRETSSRIEVCAGRGVFDAGPRTSGCCVLQDGDALSESTRLRPGAWVYFTDFLLP